MRSPSALQRLFRRRALTVFSPRRLTITTCVLAVAVLAVTAQSCAADPPLTVRVPVQDTPTRGNHSYFIALLKAALERGGPGPVTVTEAPLIGSQDRLLRYLETGEYLDVYWVGTTPDRETRLAPVRIPLTGGLLGIRLPVILPERQEEFARIRSTEDLRRYTACQGSQWPDSDILEANSLPVLRINQFHVMYHMLRAGRCDYFPRSVIEVYAEVAAQPQNSFLIDETLIMAYRYPLYFFTSRLNMPLNRRLTAGLTAMAHDGSLRALIEAHPTTAPAFPLSRYQGARVLPLVNPLLPEETPLGDRDLWVPFPGLPPLLAHPPRRNSPLPQGRPY